MADGIFLAGDEAFRQEVEELSARTAQELGIERTQRGWRLSRAVPIGPRAGSNAAL
jgi:hypothetical protein